MKQFSRREFCRQTLMAGTLALGCGTAAGAAPMWVDQRQVGPFVCQATFPLVGHESLLGELEPLQQELRRVLAVRPSREAIHVHLLATADEHRTYIAERFPTVPYRRALFVKQNGQSSVFAFLHSELADDVRHECTHAVLHADLPMVPLWLDEGLAEYFEIAKPLRARQHPHLKALKWDLRFGRVPNIRQLEEKDRLEDLTARDYRNAWAWTHYMLHGPVAAHAALITFLHDIRRNAAPGLLSDRLERAVPDARVQLVGHFKTL